MSTTTPQRARRPDRLRARGTGFHPGSWFDRVFELAIVAKGLNGAAELIGGLLLLAVTPGKIHRLAKALTQGELSEDPHDLLARYLLHTSDGLTGAAVTFGAAYLLLHGSVKVVLVVALLRNRLWAYPWMIGVLLTFVGYQLCRIARAPGAGLVALTVFDLIITSLTWREWRLRRRRRDSTRPTSVSDRHCRGGDASAAARPADATVALTAAHENA